jgi:t-SNARE syntaxin family protein
MATDPYHTFAADLRASLDTARQLSRRYQTLQSQRREQQQHSSTSPFGITSPSSSSSPSHSNHFSLSSPPTPGIETQLQDTYTELQDQLETLENDINDVQESVDMLEKRGPELFGVDSTELGKRKRFVQSCTDEVRVSVAGMVIRRGVEYNEGGMGTHVSSKT